MGKMKQYYFEDLKISEKEKIIEPFLQTLDILTRKMIQLNLDPKSFYALYLLSVPGNEDVKEMLKKRKQKSNSE